MGMTTRRPLPPVVLGKLVRPSSLQARADFRGRFGDGGPGEGLVGVEVEDEAVGVFHIFIARTPGMDFRGGGRRAAARRAGRAARVPGPGRGR